MMFSVFAPAIAIAIAMMTKLEHKNQKTASWITLASSAPTFLSCFFYYVYKSFKENNPVKEYIKPARMKYFYSGLISSFCLFNAYLGGWIIAIQTEKNIAWWVLIGIVMLLGIITVAYLSLYEFCISFDVFYSKNKKELVHDFLEKATGKKLEIIPD